MKIIIFDFDGVIEDNYELHYELSCKQFTNLTREEHKQFLDGNIHIQKEKLRHRNTGFNLPKYFNNIKKNSKIKDYIKNELINLSQEYTLGIITSAREYGILGYLNTNNISDLFDFVYGKETAKLKNDKFKMVFEKYDANKNDCIFVTDTLGDILDANEVGVKSIAIDSGFHEKERLEKGKPFKIVSNFGEIRKIMNAIKNNFATS